MKPVDDGTGLAETGISIRPIRAEDLDSVAGNCWENRETQLRLLEAQEILGLGVWQDGRCVGQLHCYAVTLPQWDDRNFPGYGRRKPVSWPLGWPLLVAKEKALTFDRPVWGHACFHVGFTPGAGQADPAYFHRGIGTALCKASIRWAREHGYAAILAQGGSKAAFAYNPWMGCLPWTTYERMSFECVAIEENGLELPWWWKKNKARPEVLQQVREAIDNGQAVEEVCARVMLLRL